MAIRITRLCHDCYVIVTERKAYNNEIFVRSKAQFNFILLLVRNFFFFLRKYAIDIKTQVMSTHQSWLKVMFVSMIFTFSEFSQLLESLHPFDF